MPEGKTPGQEIRDAPSDPDTVLPAGVHVPDENPQSAGSDCEHLSTLGQTDRPGPGDVPTTYADASALERDFGFTPKITLREGMRKFAEWYADYYGTKC